MENGTGYPGQLPVQLIRLEEIYHAKVSSLFYFGGSFGRLRFSTYGTARRSHAGAGETL